jgi:hypothetical protein
MADARERAFSTPLTSDVGARVRTIATRENRSSANVIESAVIVFTLFPKEVRDMLIDAASDADGEKRLKEMARGLMYQDAMRRFDRAMDAASEHIEIDQDAGDYDDAVVVDRSPSPLS